jgi:hypothetical protein
MASDTKTEKIPIFKIVNSKVEKNSHKTDRDELWVIQCIAECDTIAEAQQYVIHKMETDPNTMGHFTTLCHDYARDLANPDLWDAKDFDASPAAIAKRVQKFKHDYCFTDDKYLGYRRYFYKDPPIIKRIANAAGILCLKR